MGDYHGAMKAIYPLNLFETRDLLTPSIVGCNISLCASALASVLYECLCPQCLLQYLTTRCLSRFPEFDLLCLRKVV